MSELRQKKMSSHLPVLELIFKNSDIKDVFEYGCGFHSTGFFVNNAKTITSVEMNKKSWFDKLKKEMVSDKLNLLYIGGTEAISYFKSTGRKYDLVFVDGDGKLRKDCVSNAFGYSDTIAVHDINLTWRRWRNRGWLKVGVPIEYKIIVMDVAFPSTTVYTKDQTLFDELKKNKCVVIRE